MGKVKKFLTWLNTTDEGNAIKAAIDVFFSVEPFFVCSSIIVKQDRKISELEKKNQEQENRNKELEKQNKDLGRQLNNTNYQLGKKAAEQQQQRPQYGYNRQHQKA